ncbi:MAG: efflux transporter outer membrane subunit [Verrucomicrobiota bacterium]
MKPPNLLRVSLCLPALSAALLITSCTWTKRPQSDVVVPPSWQQKGGSSTVPLDTDRLAQWWTRFNDPVLNRLITDALQSSTDVRTSLARVDEARARRGVARSALFPTLSGDVSGQGARSDNRQTGVTTTDSYTSGISMSWEIDLFGKLRQSVRASSADLAQAEENYYGAQVTLAASVAESYVDLRAAEAQLAVYERNVTARSDTVQITRWKQQAGEGNGFETQQAASTLEQARATIPTLKLAITQTKNRLSLLSGKTPGALDSLLAKPRSVPRPSSTLAIGIPADTLRQRPDVRAAERGVEAAAARTRSAEREQLPSLRLNGDLGTTASRAASFLSPETAAASVLGDLSAPIFNAGRIKQTILIQSAQEKQALISYESTVLTALSEVENSLAAIRRTQERLNTLGGALTSAREAAKLASQSFEAGQADLLQVLDTQRTLLSLEEQQTLTLGDNATAHVQLYRSLGGGWSKNG